MTFTSATLCLWRRHGKGVPLILALLLSASTATAAPPSMLGTFTGAIDAWDVEYLPATSNACVAGAKVQKNFQVIGVTNPAAPAFVAHLTPNDFSGDRLTLSRDRSRAYMVGFLGGMKVIDISTPESPTQIGTYGNAGTRAVDIAVSADRQMAYMADSSAGIRLVSLANETLPALASSYQSIFSNQHQAAGVTVAHDDRHLYVASQNNGLVVLCVTNAASPTFAGQLKPPAGSGSFNDVHLTHDGSIAYVVGGEGVSDPALHIISLTNPAAPVLLSRYTDPQRGESFADLALSPDGTTGFLVGNNVGLQVVDLSNPARPRYVSQFHETIGEVSPQSIGIALSPDGGTAYIAQRGHGLRVVDVSGVYDIDDDGLPNAWELQHFNTVTGASPTGDSDADGHTQWEEYLSGSDPTNTLSQFSVTAIVHDHAPRISVESLSGRRYSLIYATQPGSNVTWRSVSGATNTPGTGATLRLTDTNRASRAFYRVNVQLAN